MSSTGVKFRELSWDNKSEVGFVYKSWINSYKNHADVIPYSMYRKLYQAIVDRILKRPGACVVLAYNPAEPDQLLGFAAFERDSPTLHYIYVKADFRNAGVGSDLLEFLLPEGCDAFKYTFNTSLGRKYLGPRGGRYKPALIRGNL